MAFEQRPNSGSLFINDRKEKETHPDLNGTLNVGGVDYYISAWQKTSSKGAQFYSLSVKPKSAPAQAAPAPLLRSAPSAPDLDDEIPF
jgi:hypothetical protein